MILETSAVSLNKSGEELCGDRVEVLRGGEGGVTMVLSDGLGSGVKASILATLTARILGTMLASGMEIGDAVRTLAQTLPVCAERHLAYATFTALSAGADGTAELIQFDNPDAVFLRGGGLVDYPSEHVTIDGKKIRRSRLSLQEGDMVAMFSDGVEYAGAGKVLNLGWQRDNIADFLRENYSPARTAREMARRLAGACRQLYLDEPGDDATVAVLRARAPCAVNVLAGPPKDPADLPQMLRRFWEAPGEKVVCGGTTSELLADYLHEKLTPDLATLSPDIPPTASLPGTALVTEGVVTIHRALAYLRAAAGGSVSPDAAAEDGGDWDGPDGASQLVRMLAGRGTSIRFFAGTAVNPAHYGPGFPPGLQGKPQLIAELADSLQKLGKTVSVEYY